MPSNYLAVLLISFSSLLLAGTPAPEMSSAQARTTITRLVLREYEITISKSIDGVTRYNVYGNDRQALDVALDIAELQVIYPSVYNSLQPAIARRGAGSDSVLMMEHRDFSDL